MAILLNEIVDSRETYGQTFKFRAPTQCARGTDFTNCRQGYQSNFIPSWLMRAGRAPVI